VQGTGVSTINPHHHFNELLIAGGSGNTPNSDAHRGSGDRSDISSSGEGEMCDELDEDELAAQMEDKYSVQGSIATNSVGGGGGSSYLFSTSTLSGALGSLGSGSHFSGAGGRSHSTGGRRGVSDEEKGGTFF
jgi:hypothetical protein